MLTIAGVNIIELNKNYRVADQSVPVLKNLNLCLDMEKITVVLGQSGCGKTTLLRIVSGLEQADSGQVRFDREAKTGIVFQESRLMPWLNVWQNITFGLCKNEIQESVIDHLITMTGLTGFESAYPSQLSGGMQQRTALARVLAYDASYILMDEPFAALDYFTRKKMQDELLKIWEENHRGVLFVTHSIDEALVLGHAVVILENGRSKKEYNLSNHGYPRDLLAPDMIEIKKDIITNIEEKGEI